MKDSLARFFVVKKFIVKEGGGCDRAQRDRALVLPRTECASFAMEKCGTGGFGKVDERRKFVRVKKEIAVAYKVVATNANPRPGILEGEAPLKSANVSPGGMCLMMDKDFPVGTVLEVTLSFEDVQERVVALSRVIWSKREDSTGNFLVGLEYNAIRDGKMDESAQFGAEYLIDNHSEKVSP